MLVAGLVVPLAGCSQGGSPDEADVNLPDLGLEATATTGLIRGVVVDEAIRPIEGAKISLQAGSASQETTTTPEGAFGFDGLEPGT